MNEKVKGWGYVIGSVIGGLVLAGALLAGLQYAATDLKPKDQLVPKDVITTTGGMKVKLGKVTAELAQTQIDVGSGGKVVVGLTAAPAWIDNVFREAGGNTATLLSGNMTICLASVVAYNSQLSGVVSTQIARECRNFEPGQMVGQIITFAEDYSAHADNVYKTQYSFINKE